jgi:hypothetical protein
MSNFGYLILVVSFWVSHFRCLIWDVSFQLSHFGCLNLAVSFQLSHLRSKVKFLNMNIKAYFNQAYMKCPRWDVHFWNIRFEMSQLRCQHWDVWNEMSDLRCLILAISFQLSHFGCLILAVSFQLSHFGCLNLAVSFQLSHLRSTILEHEYKGLVYSSLYEMSAVRCPFLKCLIWNVSVEM